METVEQVTDVLRTPFNKAQLELLKLFSVIKTEEELLELKRVIVQHYANRASDLADKIWEERGYTEKDMERLLNQPS